MGHNIFKTDLKPAYSERVASCFLVHTPTGVKTDLYYFKSSHYIGKRGLWKLKK